MDHAMHARLHRLHEGMFGLAHHAGWYDRSSGRLARPLYRHIAADVAAAALPEGAVVLDVGTGPGRVPMLIAERCPQLVVEGIDLSEEMIKQARASAGVAAPGRPSYSVADVTHLPHPHGSIDLVVSSLSLHHWGDVPAGLSEIRRVLKPGGTAWIYDVKAVLNRAARPAAASGLPVAVEPYARPGTGRPTVSALVAWVAGRLLGRLVIRA